MEAYEKAIAPGEQHKLLQKQVGKWNLSLKSWPAPDAPPMESTGTAETKSILGDRYVQTTLTSSMMGKTVLRHRHHRLRQHQEEVRGHLDRLHVDRG